MIFKPSTSNHNQNINFLQSQIYKLTSLDLQSATIKFFASSQCNDLYLLKTKEKQFLAKITNWEQNKLWESKREEFDKLEFIKNLAIAPLCYYYDLGQNELGLHWNLVDFVPGNVVEKLTDKHILQLAQILQKLHSQTIGSKHGDRWNELESTAYECFVLPEYLEKYPERSKKTGFEKLKDRFKKINWRQCSQFCLIHNDLKNLNMVQNNGQIKLIDWEYSYMDIPENDIARLFVENKFTGLEKEVFLINYLPEMQKTELNFDMEKLEVLTDLYEFFEVGNNVVQPIF